MNHLNIVYCVFLFVLGVLFIPLPASSSDTSWTTLHGNLQRHGYYSHFPQGELNLIWRKELHQELTGPRAEVIVGGGMTYLGTYEGNMYAWDATTGNECWVFETQGAIGHSPMYAKGILYFGSMDRHLYAIDKNSGNEIWRYQTDEGIWTSPVVHQDLVLFGGRDGYFYALRAETGKFTWRFKTQGPILNSASIAPNGEYVLFASEDMHLYCLKVNNGELVWKSKKLQGLSTRDYFPVVVDDLVFITTNPVRNFHNIMGLHQQMFLKWTGFEGEDDRYIPGDSSDVRCEQEKIVQFLKEKPTEQTFYAFRLEDGTEPWIAPILYNGGMHNPMTPPCYNPKRDEVYVYVRSAYGVWDGGGELRPYTGVGVLDRETGFVELIEHAHSSTDPARPAGRKDLPWMSFNTIGDETQTLSTSPNFLFSNHQGYLGSMNFHTGLCKNLFGKRDTYGGFYGPGLFGWDKKEGMRKANQAGVPYGIVNEWHGPARAIVSVADNRIYFPVGSQVLCISGEEK